MKKPKKRISRTPEMKRLRDDFALVALGGGIREFFVGDGWEGYEDFAATCFNVADAMVRERQRRDRYRP